MAEPLEELYSVSKKFMRAERQLTKICKEWQQLADGCEHKSKPSFLGSVCNALKDKHKLFTGCSPMNCIRLKDNLNYAPTISWHREIRSEE
jgi:hypothetical protein